MRFGIVTKASVWLYDGDPKKAVDELLMGWAVGILSEQDSWYKVVTHYGYHGFLKKGTFCFCTADKLCERDLCGQTAVVTRSFADILAKPKVQGTRLCTLPMGSFFTVLPERVNGYQRAALSDGREGYLPGIAYEMRKDRDGFFYEKEPDGYFLRQTPCQKGFEPLFRKTLLTYAKRYLGTQYRWAGKSPEGIDCSGLTFMSYLMCGILIYRDASLKEGYPVQSIPVSWAKPGDLLYFPGHVAMYLGNRKYIHATGNENSFGCVINSLSPEDSDYRQDLAKELIGAGSVMKGKENVS